ncbi:hypothetical protein NEFER01_2108 [Nematocida sp. LUAm1]|nr:hypothetical protein NEFER01_2108 [Nematocida sp. LUAm1]
MHQVSFVYKANHCETNIMIEETPQAAPAESGNKRISLKKLVKKTKKACGQCKKSIACACQAILKGIKKCCSWVKKAVKFKKRRMPQEVEQAQESAFDKAVRLVEEILDCEGDPILEIDEVIAQNNAKRGKGSSFHEDLLSVRQVCGELIAALLREAASSQLGSVLKRAEEEISMANEKDKEIGERLESKKTERIEAVYIEWKEIKRRYLDTLQNSTNWEKITSKAYLEWKITTINTILWRSENRFASLISELDKEITETVRSLKNRFFIRNSPVRKNTPILHPNPTEKASVDLCAVLPPEYMPRKDGEVMDSTLNKNYHLIMRSIVPTKLASMCMDLIPQFQETYNKIMCLELQKFGFPKKISRKARDTRYISLVLRRRAKDVSVSICNNSRHIFEQIIRGMLINHTDVQISTIVESIFKQPHSFKGHFQFLREPSLVNILFGAPQKVEINLLEGSNGEEEQLSNIDQQSNGHSHGSPLFVSAQEAKPSVLQSFEGSAEEPQESTESPVSTSDASFSSFSEETHSSLIDDLSENPLFLRIKNAHTEGASNGLEEEREENRVSENPAEKKRNEILARIARIGSPTPGIATLADIHQRNIRDR